MHLTRSSSVLHLAPEFEAFLLAPIGEDGHGMLLSVLSGLARLNVDPWQKAAKLAGLPVETATQQSTSLIAALPDGPSAHRDAGTIAPRLIALLPRQGGSESPERAAALGAGALVRQSRIILLVIITVLALGAQFVAASRPGNGNGDRDGPAKAAGGAGAEAALPPIKGHAKNRP